MTTNDISASMTIQEAKNALMDQTTFLNNMLKENPDQKVIDAQTKVVKKAEKTFQKAKKTVLAKANESVTANNLPFDVKSENDIIKRNMALVLNNRCIDSKRVDNFMNIIADERYDDVFPIIVSEGEWVVENNYTIVDLEGKEIPKEEASNYYAIIEGQHRSAAFAKLIQAGLDLVIPNVHIRNVENIGEYLVNINEAGKSWDKKDRFSVAAVTVKEDEVFTTISARIKEGFNPTTAAIIYTGKRISDPILNAVLKGKKYTLPKDAVFVKPKGDRFIDLCKAAGMDVKYITKKYFAVDFYSYEKIEGTEKAFQTLANLKKVSDLEEKIKDVHAEGDFIDILVEVASILEENQQ
ncbi:hypothetical protein LJB97_04455 [Parabacteroides sp. OttesenSCG-928-O15]|nr:hypothetical protein [Parabacteroides sp. OttesenSCG-928-O15]